MTMSLIGVEERLPNFASLSDDSKPAAITNAACEDHKIALLTHGL